jgi:hypothetical protein
MYQRNEARATICADSLRKDNENMYKERDEFDGATFEILGRYFGTRTRCEDISNAILELTKFEFAVAALLSAYKEAILEQERIWRDELQPLDFEDLDEAEKVYNSLSAPF